MKKILITGGAGFIGVNSAKYFSERGWRISVLDNLSRQSADRNLKWLREQVDVDFQPVDVRDADGVGAVVSSLEPDVVLHLAAQVAVTTSIASPREDFEVNALGTFNILEAVRERSPRSFVINASTNKVYGKLEGLTITERRGRYEWDDKPEGIAETQALDFHSPYGCSKGIADQYTIDYARIYGLDTVTFRQSCVYGPRQFGIEDQGWLAWFAIAAVTGKRITIYGDGKQIRDVLHVEDLARAYEAAYENRAIIRGQAFNVGGGPEQTLSLIELLEMLQGTLKVNIPIEFDEWRAGDQPVYVSNIQKARKELGWEPQRGIKSGVAELINWVSDNREVFT